MDSSSENSFAWSDTSSDSIDSLSMAVSDTLIDKNSKEIGIKHEKKRKSQALSNNSCDAVDIELDDKPKVKIEKELSHDVKRKVKLEPESDCDVPKKKKKIKHNEVNGNQNGSSVTTSYDESYLNMRVKQEEMSAPSSDKPRKKRKRSSVDDNDATSEELKLKQCSSDTHEDSASQNLQLETDSTRIKTKKKKKKSKKRSDDEAPAIVEIDDNMNVEEISFCNEHSTNQSGSSNKMERSYTNNTSQDGSGCDEISAIQCEDDHNLYDISSFNDNNSLEKENNKAKPSLYKSTIENQFKMGKNNVALDILNTEQRASRISDRIRFEDEDDAAVELSNIQDNSEERTSSKLRKFLKLHTSKRQVSKPLPQSSTLTCDDEVWIVNCPKDIDIQAFCDININIHGKAKVKVGGQTYDGSLEEEQGLSTPTLSMKNGKYEIVPLPSYGIINLRKRIPKAHFRDDNIMVNNQTNFIPLPETKCRHPLFGSNYKKALKIPSAIAEKLNSENSETEAITVKKKKKKKHQQDRSISEPEETDAKSVPNMKPEPTPEVKEKKKKKRRHADDDDLPEPKRVKRIKHDPESAEAWESEKAIEQNLFDF